MIINFWRTVGIIVEKNAENEMTIFVLSFLEYLCDAVLSRVSAALFEDEASTLWFHKLNYTCRDLAIQIHIVDTHKCYMHVLIYDYVVVRMIFQTEEKP